MTALATSTDVEAALGRTLTAEESARATGLLLLASAAVQDEASGYRFAPGAYTVGRFVRGRKVRLPGKVAAVSAVREVDRRDGTAVTAAPSAYTLHGSTLWYRPVGYAAVRFDLGSTRTFIEVDFTVTAAVPDEVVKLTAAVVANTIAAPPVGAQSETTGPFTISYVSNSGRVFLAASDKAVLRRYKLAKPALDLLG